MRASVVPHALFAVTVLSCAACREIQGQCSSRADTLCLQIGVTDHSVFPDELQLNLSAAGMSKLATFPNVASILSQRPYLVEIELANPPPDPLSIDAIGYLTAPSQKIAAAQLTLSPATAARPTVLNLAPLGSDSDLGGMGNLDMFPADLSPASDLQPAGWGMVYFSSGRPLTGISGSTNGVLNIVATGASQLVVHGNGTTFSPTKLSNGSATVSGVWLSSATAAWACDRSGMVYATSDGGANWPKSFSIGYPLNGIHGRSDNDILAVGDSTVSAAHYDGVSWKNAPHNAGLPFYGVWISGSTYYMAGGSGQGARSSTPEMAGSWTAIANLNGQTLRGMSGYLTSDMFPLAVGDAGTVEYYQMPTGTWKDLQFPKPTAKLAAAWVSGGANGYVVGAGGVVFFFNNGTWTQLGNSNLGNYDLTGIWGDGAGGLWVSASNGTDGAIFKY